MTASIVEQTAQLAAGTIAFSARGITKTYPGVRALDALDLDGYAGEVVAVCGAQRSR